MSITFKFSPKAGFPQDWEFNMISYCTTAGALEMGLVVSPNISNVIAPSNAYGYFLMQEVTTDGPSELERITGDYQMWEVKVGKPVSIMLPIEHAQIYTKHVSAGGGEPALAKGQICDLVNGAYVTAAASIAPKGKIVALPADTGITGIYVVEIMNV